LILAGEGEYLTALRQMYATNERILFTGFYPDPIGLLKNVDVLVLPSSYLGESLPTVVIEALYAGVPVIASDIQEMKSMILDETTLESAGFRIPFIGSNLDEHQLHSKMLYLLENPNLIPKLSKTAKQAFKKFDMDKCVYSYKEIYEELSGTFFS
jgi:glycosyltransferase involved in cell wall biosynthesis